VFALGVALLFSVWSLAMIAILRRLQIAFRGQLAMKLTLDKDGDGVELHEIMAVLNERVDAFLDVMSKQSLLGTTLRLLCVMIPWSFYTGIFLTCWNCFDFEAAMAHEIGHLLGLGHPDAALRLSEPQNSYHMDLAERRPWNSSNCLNPWENTEYGFPADAVVSSKGIRPSVMEEFSQHNPGVCLSVDDLEALNMLYPVCEGMFDTVVCSKSALNLGRLRLMFFIFGPGSIALALAIVLHTLIDRYEDRKERKEKAKLLIMQKLAERQRVLHSKGTDQASSGNEKVSMIKNQGRWGQAARGERAAPAAEPAADAGAGVGLPGVSLMEKMKKVRSSAVPDSAVKSFTRLTSAPARGSDSVV